MFAPQTLGETRKPAAGLAGASSPERREFIKLMGIVGAASVIALSTSFKGLLDAAIGETASNTNLTSAQSTAQPSVVPTQSALNTSTATAVEPTPVLSGSASQSSSGSDGNQGADTASSSSEVSACIVRCERKCSYPGHCRRYCDVDGNGRCDLGECASA